MGSCRRERGDRTVRDGGDVHRLEASDITRFEIDDTFWLDLVFAVAAGVLVWLRRRYIHERDIETGGDTGRLKMAITAVFVVVLAVGLVASVVV